MLVANLERFIGTKWYYEELINIKNNNIILIYEIDYGYLPYSLERNDIMKN